MNETKNIDAKFAECVTGLFLYQKAEKENRSVSHFVKWFNENGYGELKARTFYDILGGRAKPSPTVIVALLEYSDDIELHGLFTVDNSIKTGTAEALRTAADSLLATAARLEGKS